MFLMNLTYIKTVIYILCSIHSLRTTSSVIVKHCKLGCNKLGTQPGRLLFLFNAGYRSRGSRFLNRNNTFGYNQRDSRDDFKTLDDFLSLKAKSRHSEPEGEFVDYYKILSLDRSCSPEEVESKYKHINEALKTLPGVDPILRSNVDKAYKVLSNKRSRSEYDELYERNVGSNELYYETHDSDLELDDEDEESEQLEISIINDENDPDQEGGSNVFGNFISNLFGFNRPQRRKSSRPRVVSRGDVTCTADIDLKTLLLGGNVPVTVRKWDNCNFCNFNDSATKSFIDECDRCNGKGMEHKEKRTRFGFMSTSRTCMKCQGTGYQRLKDCNKCDNTGRILKDTTVKVNVPFNSKVGSVIKLKGMGHSGGLHMRDGDMYVKLQLKQDKNEYIDGGRIVTVYNLPYTKAILGDKVMVPTFIGEKEVTVEPYSQQGEEIKVGTYKNMEHYVKLNVQLPKTLSKEEQELLEKIDKR